MGMVNALNRARGAVCHGVPRPHTRPTIAGPRRLPSPVNQGAMGMHHTTELSPARHFVAVLAGRRVKHLRRNLCFLLAATWLASALPTAARAEDCSQYAPLSFKGLSCRSNNTAAAPNESRATIKERMKQRIALMESAMPKYGDQLRGSCFNSFKNSMNDPSSFQWGGDFAFNALRTDYYMDDKAYQENVFYSATARGKNQYGALTRMVIHCAYNADPATGQVGFHSVHWEVR